MHESECKSIGDETHHVVDGIISLSFLVVENACSREFKIITMSTIDCISSQFILNSNPCTYLETTANNASHVAVSISLNDHNLCKKH